MPDYALAKEKSALAEAKSDEARYHASEASRFLDIAEACAKLEDAECVALNLQAARNQTTLASDLAREAQEAADAAHAALED